MASSSDREHEEVDEEGGAESCASERECEEVDEEGDEELRPSLVLEFVSSDSSLGGGQFGTGICKHGNLADSLRDKRCGDVEDKRRGDGGTGAISLLVG